MIIVCVKSGKKKNITRMIVVFTMFLIRLDLSAYSYRDSYTPVNRHKIKQ